MNSRNHSGGTPQVDTSLFCVVFALCCVLGHAPAAPGVRVASSRRHCYGPLESWRRLNESFIDGGARSECRAAALAELYTSIITGFAV